MIAVTGANGHLGQLVIEGLLERVPANQIIATVRSLENVSRLRTRGVQVREADYSRPETLNTALHGAERVLLISVDEVSQRFNLHKAVIDASKEAKVELLVYTSLLRADTSEIFLAREHRQTEDYIRASDLPLKAPESTVHCLEAPTMVGSHRHLAPTTQQPRLPSSRKRFPEARRTNWQETNPFR